VTRLIRVPVAPPRPAPEPARWPAGAPRQSSPRGTIVRDHAPRRAAEAAKVRVMAARSAAAMTGLGAVFTHVDLGTTTSLAYHDRHGRLPHQPWVPAWPGAASLSFAGVAFRQTVVWKVRLTSGTIGLGPHDDPKQGNDIVVMDNFIQEAALRRRPSGRRQGVSPPPDVAPPPGSSRIRLGARTRVHSSLANGYRSRRTLAPLQSTTRVGMHSCGVVRCDTILRQISLEPRSASRQRNLYDLHSFPFCLL
jgi:hypothetical protein